MIEDIWDKKPDTVAELKERFGDDLHAEVLGLVRKRDAWLEKLKSSFDESIADCHHSLELVAKKLGEYTEKAEKLETVREFVLNRIDDIENDIEDFGVLKPVLNYFLEEDDAEQAQLEAEGIEAARAEYEAREEEIEEMDRGPEG